MWYSGLYSSSGRQTLATPSQSQHSIYAGKRGTQGWVGKAKHDYSRFWKPYVSMPKSMSLRKPIAHLGGRTRDLSIHCWDGNLLGRIRLWVGQHGENLSWLWILTLFYCHPSVCLNLALTLSVPPRGVSFSGLVLWPQRENDRTGTMCASWSLFHYDISPSVF